MHCTTHLRRGLVALIPILPLLLFSRGAAGSAASLKPLKTACTGSHWTLVGPGTRITALKQFTKAGGKLSTTGVRMARSKGAMQYWITPDMSVQNTCIGWSLTTVWLGANKHSHTNLLAVTMSPLSPPKAPSTPPPPSPPRRCTPVRSTKYTNHILHPKQFTTAIAGYTKLRPDLSGLALTTAWQTVRRGTYQTTFAGEVRTGRLAHHGAIEIITNGACQLGPVETSTTEVRTGPLTLTKVGSTSAHFTYSGGTGVLDLHTLRITLYVSR